MGRISEYFKKTLGDIKVTFLRFIPIPVFLAAIAVLDSMQIENVFKGDSQKIVQRIIFSAIAGAFLGTASEFLCERFSSLKKRRILLQGITLVFSAAYYFLLTSGIEAGFIPVIRLVVICFVLFAFYIWVPSYKKAGIFSNNALSHFKACFISVLYSLVLALGFIAIYFAVDLLLVKLDKDIPLHIFNIMGAFFFPLYYLSLLPDFNSGEERMLEKCRISSIYPKFLEILVSYIAIPLITLFTGVLTVYLIKIIITLIWPVGQLGPMILWYSAVGLFLYVLCDKLQNNFTQLYRKFFPIALLPLVCLQLYSVFIRIKAYGITESRYYLILFGIYSIVCAVCLILMKGSRPGIIAILAAVFAIVSIIPPTDAFTVSRASQVYRVEAILTQNNMLSSGKVSPNASIPGKDKAEITNIMGYLYKMGHTVKVSWLPAGYNHYRDFQNVFGFGEAYAAVNAGESGAAYYSGTLEQNAPMDISGYTSCLKVSFYQDNNSTANNIGFDLGGETYKLAVTFHDGDTEFSVADPSGKEQVSLTLEGKLEKLITEHKINQGSAISPSDMAMDADSGSLKIRVILQNIDFRKENGKITDLSGEALVLAGKK